MRIWITGLCGFLGSHLADALLVAGHDVEGNDSLVCGDESNIGTMPYSRHDCCNRELMHRSLLSFGPDVVVHCAATAHEGLSSFSPSFITRNIYEASVGTFSAAIAAGVKRIVYMSSMSRYGRGRIDSEEGGTHDYRGDRTINGKTYRDRASPPFTENYHLTAPVDPYGIAKVAAEDTLKILCKTHGVKWSIAVPHNIIGARQRYIDPYRNVASIMINRCKQGKGPIIYGDGMQKRCFSPVKDVIPSLLKMVDGAADGEVVNIGPDRGEITINDLAYKIIDMTGFNGVSTHMPGRPNEVRDAYCSSEKARRLLGYQEQQGIDDCLAEMIAAIEPKPFVYDFPIEIEQGCPKTWTERLM